MANPFDRFDSPVAQTGKDVALSFGQGAAGLLKSVGDIYGLTTGDMDNVVSRKAQEAIESLQTQKSPEVLQMEEKRRQAVEAETGTLDKAWAYLTNTAPEFRLALGDIAQAAPSVLGTGGAGAAVRTGARMLGAGAKTAAKTGLGGAIATGAGLQAGEAGASQYAELVKTLGEMPDEQKAQIPQIADLMKRKGASLEDATTALLLDLSRDAGVFAALTSAASMAIPGGTSIERSLVGGAAKQPAKSLLSGVAKSAAGETGQEVLENVGAEIGKNIFARPVEPEREITRGVGEAMGASVLPALAMGGAAGAAQSISRPEPTPRPAPASQVAAGMSEETPAPAATKPSLAAEQQATLERSEDMTSEQFFATVNVRQARLLGGEPNPEDIKLVGDAPPPRVIIDPDMMRSAIDETQQALNDWRAKNPNAPENMVIVFDPEMLHNGFGIQGAFNQRDGSIFINAAFVAPENVGKIASHEWAHATLASPEGQRAFAEFAAREIPQEDLNALATRYGTQDRMVLLEEWIAENQEKAPGVISRIVARIREWLSGLGILDLSDAEVADIMLRSLREQAENKIQPDTQRVEGGIAPDQNLEVYETFIGNRLDAGPKMALQKLPTAADVTDAKGNLRYTIPKKTLDVSHYSFVPDLTEVDPAYYGTGQGEHYHRMMKGINKSFFFVGNSKPKAHENVAGKGMNRYRTTIDSSRIYDMDKDPLDLWFAPNPQKSEGLLKELGYDGFLAKTDDGRSFVALFYPTSLETGEVTRAAQPVEEAAAEEPQETAEEYLARVEREEAAERRKALRRASAGKYSLTQAPADLNKISNEPETQPTVETRPAPETLLAAGERGGVPASPEGVESGGSAKVARRLGAQPNEEVRRVADAYNKEFGMGTITHGHYVPVDESLARRVAAAFDNLPELDESPETVNAYRALAREVNQQWDFAIKNLGITFEPWAKEGQPYANSREMVKDVKENKHLYFFTGGEPHPFMSQVDPETGLTSNDKFRAVHDLFGHAAEDYQFGPRGEENAWIKHSQMFSPEAQRALSTETRGQNSWVNSGAHNYDGDRYLNIPVAERPYAKQKIALLPEELTDWRAALDREKPRFSLAQTKTPEFKAWFGDSQITTPEGTPQVMYHGTYSRKYFLNKFGQKTPVKPDQDFTVFKPSERRGGTIFVSPSPEFASKFAMDTQDLGKKTFFGTTPEELAEERPGARVYPVFVKSENPFDFENEEHVRRLFGDEEYIEVVPGSKDSDTSDIYGSVDYDGVASRRFDVEKGRWEAIENLTEQIKNAGFDGFYVWEEGVKNLGVFNPKQLVSATGNVGAFGQRPVTAEEAERMGLTEEEAAEAQKRGDIRFSLAQTKTPEFKRFFGDWDTNPDGASKVVDENGKPRILFHGTIAGLDFAGFNTKSSAAGSHFATIPAVASSFAKGFRGPAGSRVIPVYLNIRNPWRSRDLMDWSGTSVIKEWANQHGQTYEKVEQEFNRVLEEENAFSENDTRQVQLFLKSKGHDGIVYLNRYEVYAPGEENIPGERYARMSGARKSPTDEEFLRSVPEATDAWIAFDPEQIKSAIGNVGAFGQRPVTAEEAQRLGMTEEKAAEAQKRGDIRMSLTGKPVGEQALEDAKTTKFKNQKGTAKYLGDLLKKQFPEGLDNQDPKTASKLAELLDRELSLALTMPDNADAIGWYGREMDKVVQILGSPELNYQLDDPVNRGVFNALLAITSNGQEVVDQFLKSAELYEGWRKNGTIPAIGKWGGERNRAMKGQLKFLNMMMEQVGPEKTVDFLTSENSLRDHLDNLYGMVAEAHGLPAKATVEQKEDAVDKYLNAGIPSGELKDYNTVGAIVFGPKLGGGFFANLYGKFDRLTMDRWFMRTFHRMTGRLGFVDNGSIQGALDEARRDLGVAEYFTQLAAGAKPEGWKPVSKDRLSDEELLNYIKVEGKKAFKNYKEIKSALKKDPNDASLLLRDMLRRTYNRIIKAESGLFDSPDNGTHRVFIRDVLDQVQKLRAERGEEKIDTSDIQAILWYLEKDIWDKLKDQKVKDDIDEQDDDDDDSAGRVSYSNGARELYRQKTGKEYVFKNELGNERSKVLASD